MCYIIQNPLHIYTANYTKPLALYINHYMKTRLCNNIKPEKPATLAKTFSKALKTFYMAHGN